MLQVNTIGKYTRFRVYSRKNTRLKKTNKQTNEQKNQNTMTSKTLFPPGRKKSQQNIKQTPVIAITKY